MSTKLPAPTKPLDLKHYFRLNWDALLLGVLLPPIIVILAFAATSFINPYLITSTSLVNTFGLLNTFVITLSLSSLVGLGTAASWLATNPRSFHVKPPFGPTHIPFVQRHWRAMLAGSIVMPALVALSLTAIAFINPPMFAAMTAWSARVFMELGGIPFAITAATAAASTVGILLTSSVARITDYFTPSAENKQNHGKIPENNLFSSAPQLIYSTLSTRATLSIRPLSTSSGPSNNPNMVKCAEYAGKQLSRKNSYDKKSPPLPPLSDSSGYAPSSSSSSSSNTSHLPSVIQSCDDLQLRLSKGDEIAEHHEELRRGINLTTTDTQSERATSRDYSLDDNIRLLSENDTRTLTRSI